MHKNLVIFIADAKLFTLLRKLSKQLPHFPDGRINYSHAKIAPVINCTVICKGKILLLKRGRKVRSYKGKWNTIGGYLDELKPVRQKALEEIEEELGLGRSDIKRIKVFKPFRAADKKIKKVWIVFPVLAELKRMKKIKLDWEHTSCRWVLPKDIKRFNTIPNLHKAVNKMLAK